MPRKSPAAVRLSTGKKILFALVVVTLCVAALEFLLAVLGVRPLLFERDPYVGFSSDATLFREETGPDGQVYLATAKERLEFFNPQRFPKRKASGTYRIFSMGGSTTYGHPYSDPTSFNGWLREFLTCTAPEHSWEVINAGGISYGSYRVARLMEELARYEPDLFVVYTGHNEFLEKRIYGKITQHSAVVRELSVLARQTRIGTVLQRVMAAAMPKGKTGEGQTLLPDLPQTMLDNALGPTAYSREEQNRDEVFAHYRFNIERMIDIARAVGAKIIFVTPASNLRDCSPFKSEFRKGLPEADQKQVQELLRQSRRFYSTSADPTEGLKLTEQACAIDDSFADAHYARGRFLEKMGRFAEAKQELERAREEDICPLRAPNEIPSILADVCAKRGVPLIDFAGFVEKLSDHEITDGKFFLDHVHLTIEGYRLVALEILKVMEREKIAPVTIQTAAIEQATKNVEQRVDARANSFALMNLCKTMGWAGKREEAFRAGEKAAALAPDNPRVCYEAALAASLAGRSKEAVGHYRRVIALQPQNGEAHCGLGVVLEKEGQLKEAVEHYRLALQYGKPATRVRDNYNLTNALARLPAD